VDEETITNERDKQVLRRRRRNIETTS